MELYYIWIKDYNFFKKKEINFSSRFLIHLEEQMDEKFILHITENPDYIPDFFQLQNISNVTAIVGQNGTGKSSILEYIKSKLPSGMISSLDGDIVAFYHSEDKKHNIAVPSSMEIEITGLTDLFSILRYDPQGISSEPLRAKNSPAMAEYIYYSFFLDFKHEPQAPGLRNISTTALLNEHRVNVSEDFPSNDLIPDHTISDQEIMMRNEIARTIQLLISEFADQLPFQKPEELIIIINSHDHRNLTIPENFRPRIGVPKSFLDLIQALDKKANSIQESIISKFHICMFLNFLYSQFVHNANGPKLNDIDVEFGQDDTVPRFIRKFYLNVISYNEQKKEDPAHKYVIEKCQSLLQFMDITEILYEQETIKIRSGNDPKEKYELFFPLGPESDKAFEIFMNAYLLAKGFTTPLDFRWRNLSTGEQSFLSFLSRVHHLRFHSDPLPKHLVFLIDEGDAGYHPSWQRSFFMKTIHNLSRMFKDSTLQFIFTTNTPFLTSDLTNPHIVFIEKKTNGVIIIHNKDRSRGNTFGANIHELFANTFYMDGVLMGDFARQRINDIIAYLKDKKQKRPAPGFKKTISLIGEPILKKKLQDMWIEKFRDDEENILLERLAEIRKQKKDKN